MWMFTELNTKKVVEFGSPNALFARHSVVRIYTWHYSTVWTITINTPRPKLYNYAKRYPVIWYRYQEPNSEQLASAESYSRSRSPFTREDKFTTININFKLCPHIVAAVHRQCEEVNLCFRGSGRFQSTLIVHPKHRFREGIHQYYRKNSIITQLKTENTL